MNKTIEEDVDYLIAAHQETLEQLKGFTVLITGALGLVGSYLVDLFCRANETTDAKINVVGIDNLISGWSGRLVHLNGRKDFSFINLDISAGLNPFLRRADLIFHCASIASPVFYRQHPLETIGVNVSGTQSMLQKAVKDKANMIHFSTSEVYGNPAKVPTPETYNGNVSLFGDRACYDESKRLSEVLCYSYCKIFNLELVVVRPSNIYGPGQRLDDGRIVPALMQAAIRGSEFRIAGDGSATRSFCYIRDALEQVLYLVFHGDDGGVYNIGDDSNEVSVREMIELVRKIAPICVQDEGTSYGTAPMRRRPDMSKMPIKPKISLAEGLERTLRSYVERDSRILS